MTHIAPTAPAFEAGPVGIVVDSNRHPDIAQALRHGLESRGLQTHCLPWDRLAEDANGWQAAEQWLVLVEMPQDLLAAPSAAPASVASCLTSWEASAQALLRWTRNTSKPWLLFDLAEAMDHPEAFALRLTGDAATAGFPAPSWPRRAQPAAWLRALAAAAVEGTPRLRPVVEEIYACTSPLTSAERCDDRGIDAQAVLDAWRAGQEDQARAHAAVEACEAARAQLGQALVTAQLAAQASTTELTTTRQRAQQDIAAAQAERDDLLERQRRLQAEFGAMRHARDLAQSAATEADAARAALERDLDIARTAAKQWEARCVELNREANALRDDAAQTLAQLHAAQEELESFHLASQAARELSSQRLAQVQRLESELSELRAQATASQRAHQDLAAAQTALQAQQHDMARADAALRGELAQTLLQLHAAQEELEATYLSSKASEHASCERLAALQGLEVELKELRAQAATGQRAQQDLGAAQAALRQAQQDLVTAQAATQQARQAAAGARTENESLLKQLRQAQADLAEATRKLADQSGKLDAQRVELDRMRRSEQSVQAALTGLQSERDRIAEQLASTEKESGVLLQQLHTVQEELEAQYLQWKLRDEAVLAAPPSDRVQVAAEGLTVLAVADARPHRHIDLLLTATSIDGDAAVDLQVRVVEHKGSPGILLWGGPDRPRLLTRWLESGQEAGRAFMLLVPDEPAGRLVLDHLGRRDWQVLQGLVRCILGAAASAGGELGRWIPILARLNLALSDEPARLRYDSASVTQEVGAGGVWTVKVLGVSYGGTAMADLELRLGPLEGQIEWHAPADAERLPLAGWPCDASGAPDPSLPIPINGLQARQFWTRCAPRDRDLLLSVLDAMAGWLGQTEGAAVDTSQLQRQARVWHTQVRRLLTASRLKARVRRALNG